MSVGGPNRPPTLSHPSEKLIVSGRYRLRTSRAPSRSRLTTDTLWRLRIMSSRRRRRHRHRTTSDAHAAPDPTAVGEDADLAAGPPESRAEAPGLPARVEATIVPARDL